MSGLKAVIGEYGKIIMLAVVLCAIVLFLFGKDQAGFMGMLKQAKPVESVGHKSAFQMARAIAQRMPPKLSVTARKLNRNEVYNLLDEAMFAIKATNEDGEKVKVSVVSMIDPAGMQITESKDPHCFVPDRQGKYYVTYQAEESYLGSIKTTEKVYCFVAD